jgi:hypothetical protein
MKPTSLSCALVLVLTASAVSHAQFFDFNGGTAGSLTAYNPLATVGMGGTFSFPAGAAQFQHPGVPEPFVGEVGPARLGYHNSTSVSDFNSSVEIISWNESAQQSIALVARLDNLGLGTTSGYGLFYSFNTEDFSFASLSNEAATALTTTDHNNFSASVTLQPGTTYRMMFMGEGTTLTGIMQEQVGVELFIDIAFITIDDDTYASGLSGVLATTCGCAPTSPVDVTIDNLFVAVPEPHEYAAATALGLIGFAFYRRRQK